MLVVNITANLIVIPRLGGPGAAWATLVTELALTLCCLVALSGRQAGRASDPGPRTSGSEPEV